MTISRNENERVLIANKLAHNRASYEAGLSVVLAHARFTSDGEAIFDACREAMVISASIT